MSGTEHLVLKFSLHSPMLQEGAMETYENAFHNGYI